MRGPNFPNVVLHVGRNYLEELSLVSRGIGCGLVGPYAGSAGPFFLFVFYLLFLSFLFSVSLQIQNYFDFDFSSKIKLTLNSFWIISV